MQFKNKNNEEVEINRDNFGFVKGDAAPGYLIVELKGGTEVTVKATMDDIKKAINGGTWK